GLDRRALLKLAGVAVGMLASLGRFPRGVWAGTRRPATPPNQVSAEEVREFTRQFSQMIDEGRSLVRSLTDLARQQRNPCFQKIIVQVCDEVQQGQTLSRAMRCHPEAFDPHYA